MWFRCACLIILILLFVAPASFTARAQACPSNIDFESGAFTGWTTYTGSVAAIGGQNTISLSPTATAVGDRHAMNSANPGDGLDPYGGFPVNCPNGSGHSIKLGNTSGGGEAEGIAYEFTIPANENAYTLIYNYAVVFQDPNHQMYEQPRMEIEVKNVTDNTVISCASFSFFPYGSTLPGFFTSPNPGSETPVLYKDWSAVSVNLAGNAGKTIRLFFKTADCTFRRHFGYAYIDVNSECSGTFVGATYCPEDTVINVMAPFGYEGYTWYNNSLTQVLGSKQVLSLKPPPAAGTVIAVKLVPYSGYGCPQTLFAKLVDTLTVVSRAGRDTISCNRAPVPIGVLPKLGLVYKWSPERGLSNPNIANPYANPDVTTTYVVTTNHDGGGCISTDTVVVRASVIVDSLQLLGKAALCSGSGDSAVLRIHPTDTIQWFKDNLPIGGARATEYKVTQTGFYNARLANTEGCQIITKSRDINISSIPVAGVNVPVKLDQCLIGNQFSFTNTSTNAQGAMQYRWVFGDGTERTTKDVQYSYTRAGTYQVKMYVNSSAICADSSKFNVVVYQNAVANFKVDPTCVNLPVELVNNTVDTGSSPVNYTWNLGNGQVSRSRYPPALTYTVPGNYPITLSVNTAQCPTPLHTVVQNLIIDKPAPGRTYPVDFAAANLALRLQAREIGDKVTWRPSTNLNNATSYTPVFTGNSEQTYHIELKTNSGCVTNDTQQVKIIKQVEIFVPNAFTPNNDGKNDYLHPIMRGIKEVRFFKIFNRWGELVYEMNGSGRGWNGTYKGVMQPTQTVVWMMEGVDANGRGYAKKGTSILVR